MNKVVLLGRWTKDFEVRYSQGENPTAIAKNMLAVNRKFKRDGEQEADFITCTAFGKTAENLDKFFKKGSLCLISGRIQTGSYTNQEGNKVYTTDVIVEEFDFCESKKSENVEEKPVAKDADGFMNVPEGIGEDELPFAHPTR